MFWLVFQPKDDYQWITAGGVKIQSVPKDAKIVYVNDTMANHVKEIYTKGKLIAFRRQSIGGWFDTVKAREKAKLNALKELSEYFNIKVSNFEQLVEGQIQSISVNTNKEQLLSTALKAYKSVTQTFSSGEFAGAYVYAVWEGYIGSVVYTSVLLVFDPEGVVELTKSMVMFNEEVAKKIEELGRNGVDFFKALNAVIEEARK
ncbi:MAG: hypothetical protein ACP5PP_05250 [Fervidobacterium sp.]